MEIGIICKVIDNYGDAGFSLRLAKAFATQGHSVTLFHDHPTVFKALYPNRKANNLILLDARELCPATTNLPAFDMIVEPFGTSSEQTAHRFDSALKKHYPETPWLLIDYLSSEQWVEDFHFSQSIDPATGHQVTYFYPGFTLQTGGLIHCDYPAHLRKRGANASADQLHIFVFSYPNAPLGQLLDACRKCKLANTEIRVGVAGTDEPNEHGNWVSNIPFVPQSQFDELLARHDFLFVRGEDSFVRAQLAGKPFIWQIYPTDDRAHADKLSSFFEKYANGLSGHCKNELWNCWGSWNRLEGYGEFSSGWEALLPHLQELNSHALQWSEQLFNGPELVKEVLTWRHGRTPKSINKTGI